MRYKLLTALMLFNNDFMKSQTKKEITLWKLKKYIISTTGQ